MKTFLLDADLRSAMLRSESAWLHDRIEDVSLATRARFAAAVLELLNAADNVSIDAAHRLETFAPGNLS